MCTKGKVIFVLGGPGAGKGTQCAKIVKKFNFEHLSAGELLREERDNENSKYGSLIDDCMRNGKIVPVDITCSLLEAAMKKSSNNKFLIDGFPRNQDNLNGWNKQMSDKVDFQFVLFFDCSEEVCINRCLSRGKCGSGRPDDNIESLKKRIAVYKSDSLPIIQYFKKIGKVKQINAKYSVDEVFEEVKKIFNTCGF